MTNDPGPPPPILVRIMRNPAWIAGPFTLVGFLVGLRLWNPAAGLVIGVVVGAAYWFMWRPGGPNRRKVLRKYGPAAFGLASEDD
jgi:hypothetical protein